MGAEPGRGLDRNVLREGLILAAFLALCGVAVWSVVLPELEDQRDPSEAGAAADTPPDAGGA